MQLAAQNVLLSHNAHSIPTSSQSTVQSAANRFRLYRNLYIDVLTLKQHDFYPSSCLNVGDRMLLCAPQVLCASNDAHDQVEPILPPEGVPLGEKVSFEG